MTVPNAARSERFTSCQGETFEELLQNLYEAIEGCLSVNVAEPKAGGKERILEIAV
jgi:predicted RNase H-like HicB family nuclease